MSDVPYRFYKVSDITTIDDSKKTAGAVFFDDATETIHIYGADGTPVIYCSRKWVWNGESADYTEFVKNVGVGDTLQLNANVIVPIVRKEVPNGASGVVFVYILTTEGQEKYIFTQSGSLWKYSSKSVIDYLRKEDANFLPSVLDYDEYTFTEKVTPEVKNESATIRSIKGNSVVWNQQSIDLWKVQHGTLSFENDIYTITPTGTYPGIWCNKGRYTPIGHKVLVGVYTRQENTSSYQNLYINYQGTNVNRSFSSTVPDNLVYRATIFTVDKTNSTNCTLFCPSSTTLIQYKNPQIFDLTQMFGAGNEPTTVEEFNERTTPKPIGIDPNAYNAGQLITGNYSGIKTTSTDGAESTYDFSWLKVYFPNGVNGIGDVRDEIRYNTETQKWESIQRIGVRAYADTDSSATSIITDGTTTLYILDTPVVSEIYPPTSSYKAFEGGTEMLLTDSASTPITAEIAYDYDAIQKIESINKALKDDSRPVYNVTNIAQNLDNIRIGDPFGQATSDVTSLGTIVSIVNVARQTTATVMVFFEGRFYRYLIDKTNNNINVAQTETLTFTTA